MPSQSQSSPNTNTSPDHLNTAKSEGTKGFLVGAARYGSLSIAAHVLGTALSPIYRGLTVQFKVFMQISAMTLGGFIWAERRVKEYEEYVRKRNRALARSSRAWNDLEREEQAARDKRRLE